MSEITFQKEEKEVLVRKIQLYFNDELDQELGQFDAEFLLDFISKDLGAYYYNKGLFDAQQLVDEKVEALKETIYELEKTTEFMR